MIWANCLDGLFDKISFGNAIRHSGEFVRVYQKKKVDGKKTKKTLVKFNLDGNPSFDTHNAGIFCVLRRVARSWRFEAIPHPTQKPITLAALHQTIGLK